MKKRNMAVVWIILICAFLLGLSGVPLAGSDSESAAKEEMQIGVLITTEYLDLFDMESYMNDNIDVIMSGKNVIEDQEPQYEGRIYAVKTQESYTDEAGGVHYSPEYAFENIEGAAFYSARIEDEAGEAYHVNGNSEGVIDANIHSFFQDDEEREELEGTIYVTPGHGGIYYFNPVFQDSDGNVFVTSGNGFDISNSMSEGSVYGQMMESSTTKKVNGKSKKYSVKVAINVAVKFMPEKITVVQMNDNHQEINRTEYLPDAMPESLKPDKDTAYLIVETSRKNPEEGDSKEREIYGPDDETFNIYKNWKNGILKIHSTEIEWK